MIRAFSFLRRDPQSGLLSFRLQVPGHLQKLIGRTEIKRSLRTADKRLAMPVAFRLYCELQDYFKRLETGEPMQKAKRQAAIQDNNDGISKITFDELILPNGAKVKGGTIDSGDHEKDDATFKNILGLGGIVATTPAADSAKLATICKRYRAEKIMEKSWTEKTAAEHENLHELLIQVIGNPEISTVTHKAAREFKETLLQLPSNMTKGRFAGKTVKQILAMSIPDRDRLANKTVNEKL